MGERVRIDRMIAHRNIHEDRRVANGARQRADHRGVVPLLHSEGRIIRDAAE